MAAGGWKPNTLGAIDDPPDYGVEARTAYLAEEGKDALIAALGEGGEGDAE